LPLLLLLSQAVQPVSDVHARLLLLLLLLLPLPRRSTSTTTTALKTPAPVHDRPPWVAELQLRLTPLPSAAAAACCTISHAKLPAS
jgi:hypothetical protein